MPTLLDLIRQKEELEARIAEVRASERASAIENARAIIAEHGLTAEDLFSAKSVKEKKVIAAKYKNQETGDTWTGRGRAPKWLDGKNKEDFLIS